jgi:hypothetical protein
VDDIIFTAGYLSELASQQVPVLRNFDRRYLVLGGIDPAKYRIAWRKKTGNKVAMAAYLNPKKNLPLALQIFAKARQNNPKLELHIAGEWQDSRLQVYVHQVCQEMGIGHVVFFHPWQGDLNKWFEDKDFFLSTSVEESLQYALAEGMACGLKPVIHCWLSADEAYPPQYIFRTVDEAVAMLAKVGDRRAYRGWVAEHLSLDKEAKRIERILRRPRVAILGELSESWRIEPQILKAMQDLGCIRAAPEGAEMILCCNPGYLAAYTDNGHKPLGGKKVVWYAEQVVGKSKHAAERRQRLESLSASADTVFVSHPQAAKAISLDGRFGGSLFCGGADYRFPPRNGVEKEYDLGFYGVPSGRRKRIIERLSKAGHKVAILESYDPRKLTDFVSKCRAVLNIHATDAPNLETRLSEVMGVGTLVLTEKLPRDHPFPDGTYWEWRSFGELLKQVERLKEKPEEANLTAARGHHYVWKHLRLEHQVEKLLEGVNL